MQLVWESTTKIDEGKSGWWKRFHMKNIKHQHSKVIIVEVSLTDALYVLGSLKAVVNDALFVTHPLLNCLLSIHQKIIRTAELRCNEVHGTGILSL